MSRPGVKMIAGFFAAVLIIAAFALVVGWENVFTSISGAHPGFLFAAVILAFAAIFVQGVAWWQVVDHVTPTPFAEGMQLFYAAVFTNYVTPMGAVGGEPVIAYILSRDRGIPMEESFSAVLVADALKSVQWLSFAAIGGGVFLFFFSIGPTASFLLHSIGVALAIVLFILLLLATNKGYTVRLVSAGWEGMSIIPVKLGLKDEETHVETDFRRKGETFHATVTSVLGTKKTLLVVSVVFQLSVMLEVVSVFFFLNAVGVSTAFSTVFFILPVALCAGFLPLPGGLGGIEAVLAGLLRVLAGVPTAAAFAATLLYRFVTYWVVLFIGGVFLSNLSVDVWSRLQEEQV